MASRGIRNNNPGNIRKSKDKWQGLADKQPDKEFFTFKDPTYGIRAMARILIKYYDDYDLDTVEKVIGRWAPPVENNTASYVKAVADAVGVAPDEVISLQSYNVLFPMLKAIIKHENGTQPYTDLQIQKGLTLAGIEPDKKPLKDSNTIKAGVASGGLATMSVVAEAISQTAPAFSLVEKIAQYAPYALGLLIVLVAGYIIWNRIDERKKGLI